MRKWIGLVAVALIVVLLASTGALGAANRWITTEITSWLRMRDDAQLRFGGATEAANPDFAAEYDTTDDRLELYDTAANMLAHIADEGTVARLTWAGSIYTKDLSIGGGYASTGVTVEPDGDIWSSGLYYGTLAATSTVPDGALSANVSLLGQTIDLETETTGDWADYLIDGEGTTGQIWTSDGDGRGGWGAAAAVSFLGLSDTPSSYASSALKFPRVNAAANALEFVTQSSIGDDMGDVDTEAELEAALTDTTNVLVSTELDSEAELESLLADVTNVIVGTEVDTEAELEALLGDTTDVVTNNDANYAFMIDSAGTDGYVWTSDGTGVGDWEVTTTTLLGLSDTPSTYSGAALKFLQVNAGGTGVEFVTNGVTGDDMGTVDTEAELESALSDVSNVIVSTEIDTKAELEAILSDVTTLMTLAQMDTEAELEALLTDTTGIFTTNDAAYAFLIPDAGTDGQVWTADGTGAGVWEDVAGDVTGPGSSTDNAVPRFDGTDGDTLQDSGVTVDDSNNMTVGGDLTVTGNDITSPGALTISANSGSSPVTIDSDALIEKNGAASLTLTDTSAASAGSPVGTIYFKGEDVASASRAYAKLIAYEDDIGAATADGSLAVDLIIAGSNTTVASFSPVGLNLLGTLEVEGKELDIGDAGGFSGLKFDAGDSEVQLYVDGMESAVFVTTGMAKKAPLILSAPSGTPAVTNGCGAATLAETTTNKVNYWYLPFSDSADEICWWGGMAIPADFKSGETTLKMKIHWMGPSGGSGEVVRWEMAAACIADGESMDLSVSAGTTVEDTWQNAAYRHATTEFTVTIQTSPAVGEYMTIRLKRVKSHANDTLTGDARFLGAYGYYVSVVK